MKNVVGILAIIFAIGTASAQEIESNTAGRNEIKGNLGYIPFEIAELSYERILSKHIGIGLSGAYVFADNLVYRGWVLPYFRYYVAENREAEGFFLEGHSGVIFTSDTEQDFNLASFGEEIKGANFGFGISVGGKFVSSGGFVGEINLGIGREFNDETSTEIYPRAGMTFGYQF